MAEVTGFFCDDVRQERNGKFIFIGTYTAEMVVAAYPFQTNLCPVLLILKPPPDVRSVKVRLVSQAGAFFGSASFEVEGPHIQSHPPKQSLISMPPIGITLSGDDVIQLWSSINEEPDELAFELPIIKGLVPGLTAGAPGT